MRIERLYRYPVKGLSPEALDSADVAPGETLPWDRAFALAQGDAPFDPAAPTWLKKTNFMCLSANARAATLRSSFDASSGVLTIRAPDGAELAEDALRPIGRARIAAWLAAFLGTEARGEPVFHHVPGHSFGDQKAKVVSLLNVASVAELERRVGARRHRRRFRANVIFSGAPAWSELEWVDREIMLDGARMRVVRRTKRCPATQVNPETGERDADPVAELLAAYGHPDLGVHAEVIEGGRIEAGGAMTLLQAAYSPAARARTFVSATIRSRIGVVTAVRRARSNTEL